MSDLSPDTVEECCTKKRQFMRLLQVSEAAINHLDKRICKIQKAKEQKEGKPGASKTGDNR
jgi:hypothetical protein